MFSVVFSGREEMGRASERLMVTVSLGLCVGMDREYKAIC